MWVFGFSGLVVSGTGVGNTGSAGFTAHLLELENVRADPTSYLHAGRDKWKAARKLIYINY